MQSQYINKITFGIQSNEEIIKSSVLEITDDKNLNSELLGTPLEFSQKCTTCDLYPKYCIGHFGHIKLSTPICHPLYEKKILMFLQIFCYNCSKLLVTHEHYNILMFQEHENLKNVIDKIKKINICPSCNEEQPKFTTDNGNFYILQEKNKILFDILQIIKVFKSIREDDLRLLHFNDKNFHPSNLIIHNLPVCPVKVRPYINVANNPKKCEDDLTLIYKDILKLNTKSNEKKKQMEELSSKVLTLFDNTNKKEKHKNSTKAYCGIKDRLCGKEGFIRKHIMGKRNNFSARSVIGPDTTLKIDEIAIGPKIASILNYPEIVNNFNIDKLQQYVYDNKVNVIVRDNIRKHVKYLDKKNLKLQMGDIVQRKLMDDDIVLINRQPTLHTGGMLAKKVKIKKGKTIRLNLAITKTFNADFDGDEMNIFIPFSYLSRSELVNFSTAINQLISAQSSQSIVEIVQDSLIGVYLMTNNTTPIKKDIFFQLIQNTNISFDFIEKKLNFIEKIYKHFNLNISRYNGKSLFSLLLPFDFMYYYKNNAMKNEEYVHIHKGVLIKGAINKHNLKGNSSSFITMLAKEYPKNVVYDFINNIQYIANNYILWKGFTISIADCFTKCPRKEIIKQVEDYIEKNIKDKKHYNEIAQEQLIHSVITNATEIGMKYTKDNLFENNNFLSTIISGSKGDYFNLTQIGGLLGQQHITGNRIQADLNRGLRTLPHYPFQIEKVEMELESKGFIKNSFLSGLNPQEFWFHAMTGREGVTDTAMKTAKSGYVQRRITKLLEDIEVKYDNTCRNSVNNIIQFSYGADNLCPRKTVIKNEEPIFCDIERLSEKINAQYENS